MDIVHNAILHYVYNVLQRSFRHKKKQNMTGIDLWNHYVHNILLAGVYYIIISLLDKDNL